MARTSEGRAPDAAELERQASQLWDADEYDEGIYGPAPEPMRGTDPELAPELVPELVPTPMPGPAPDLVPSSPPGPVPEPTSGSEPGPAPNPMPGSAPEPGPPDAPLSGQPDPPLPPTDISLEIPPEIVDWLNGCYRLEPDGSITEAMDLTGDPFEETPPSPTDPPLSPPPSPPPKKRWRRWRFSSYFLCFSLALFVVAFLFGGMVWTSAQPFMGLSFHPTPGNMRDALPLGALIVTRRTDPEFVKLHDTLVIVAHDGVPSLGKVVAIDGDGGMYAPINRFRLRSDGTASELAAAGQVNVLVGSAPVLGAMLGFVHRNLLISLYLPSVLLIAAVILKVVSARRTRRQET